MSKRFENFEKNKILALQNKICFEDRYKSFSCVVKLIKDRST